MSESKADMETPIELEHLIGLTGDYTNCFISHPNVTNEYIHSVGSTIVVGDFNDPLSVFVFYIFCFFIL